MCGTYVSLTDILQAPLCIEAEAYDGFYYESIYSAATKLHKIWLKRKKQKLFQLHKDLMAPKPIQLFYYLAVSLNRQSGAHMNKAQLCLQQNNFSNRESLLLLGLLFHFVLNEKI